ncbi:ATP-dependent DNA helicase [Bdellovibrio sp. HCB290]|uniref:ATP-dependent DNA helicase n=1 Tax=Bdellovibrio sp. HCB290 TaxID=3394356 RepID=UPI0039B61C7D
MAKKNIRKIQIDLRQFALPCPRVGSIEAHSGYGQTPRLGQEIHQSIQRKRIKDIPGYEAEKKLSIEFERDQYIFVISGRADGVVEGSSFQVEEIKSAFDVDGLEHKLTVDDNHPYVWQLRTYGYILYKQTGEIPDLKMLLVSSRNFKQSEIYFDLDIEEYESWLALRLAELVEETKIREKLFKKRVESSEGLKFPFTSPRPGQVELIENIQVGFVEEKSMVIQAPTGLGKTIGVLYPSLKDSLARGQKVIYVTPKNSQHQVAEEAVERLQDEGASIRPLTITAKSKMCFKAEPLCNPQYCEFAKDYYKKVAENDLVNKVSKLRSLSQKKLQELGEQYQVCPFELSIEAIERADVVIADYNYVFSTRSLLGRLELPLMEPTQKANLVIDEAHNLPARAQDYFSPSISTRDLQNIIPSFSKIALGFQKRAQMLCEEAIEIIESYRGESRTIQINFDPVFELESRLREFLSEYLEADVEVQTQDGVLRLVNTWTEFAQALELQGPEFFQTYQKNRIYGETNETLKVTCCDASAHLNEIYKSFKNVVAFSATLKPFAYSMKLLGFDEQSTKCLEFVSPFPKEHRKILLIPQISTKYKDRPLNAPKIAQAMERIMVVKPGNYIALFPSFEFMKDVEGYLKDSSYQRLVQQREMKADRVEDFLSFMKSADKPTLLLAVQGGIFSEGVDFPGDMLIGAFVIGPALPNFDFEREQIRQYYERSYDKGQAFNYTYVYPAMAKTIQSAGRVIRSENDKGIIVLMDSRFLETTYAETMPQGWFEQGPQELVSGRIISDLTEFWSSLEPNTVSEVEA